MGRADRALGRRAQEGVSPPMGHATADMFGASEIPLRSIAKVEVG